MMEDNSLDIITEYLPEHCRCSLQKVKCAVKDKATEIVLRADAPFVSIHQKRCFMLRRTGSYQILVTRKD